MAGGPVQGNQMRIVGDHEYFVVEDSHATVRTQSRVSNKFVTPRTRILPNLAAGERIQRKGGIWSRHIHDAIRNDGRRFQPEVAHVLNEIVCIGK